MQLELNIKMLKQGIEVNTDKIPERVYLAALKRGLEDFINRWITKAKFDTTDLEGDALEAMKAKVVEKAEANIQDVYADKIRIVGAKKKSGVPRAVLTEAMRMAKEQLKVLLKKQKVKLSTIKAKDLTQAAQAYLEANPAILKKAYEMVEDRETAPQAEAFDLSALIGVSKENTVLSAKQAGKPKKRGQGAAANA